MVSGLFYFLTWESILDAFDPVRTGATRVLSHICMKIVLVLREYRYVYTFALAAYACMLTAACTPM